MSDSRIADRTMLEALLRRVKDYREAEAAKGAGLCLHRYRGAVRRNMENALANRVGETRRVLDAVIAEVEEELKKPENTPTPKPEEDPTEKRS